MKFAYFMHYDTKRAWPVATPFKEGLISLFFEARVNMMAVPPPIVERSKQIGSCHENPKKKRTKTIFSKIGRSISGTEVCTSPLLGISNMVFSLVNEQSST